MKRLIAGILSLCLILSICALSMAETRFKNRAARRISNYAMQAMKWDRVKRLIGGTGKGIEPKGTATRAQIAEILQAFDINIRK